MLNFIVLSLFPFFVVASDITEHKTVEQSIEQGNKAYIETGGDEVPQGRKQLILGILNDFFTPNSTDRHLTNAIKIGYVSDKLPSFLQWYEDPFSTEYYIVTINQEMYTPEDIEDPELIEDDRPYAGWTYLSFALGKRRGGDISITALNVGIIGENSFASRIQIEYHELIGARDPNGWEHQLDNQVGINFSHYRGRTFRVEQELFTKDITPYIGMSVGNVKTELAAGVVARYGLGVPEDVVIGFDHEDLDYYRLYATGAIGGSYVFRDIFLDGNGGHSVEKNNLVGTASFGVTVGLGNFEFSYTYVFITEQFKTQDGPDKGGLVEFNYKKKI